MNSALRALLLASVLLAVSGSATGQAATGTPKFGSFGGGQFDTVNLGNLNVHFAVPLIHKAGRGMPFTYDLSYDSSVWYPVGVSGNQSWQPVSNWGWRAATESLLGYSTYTTSQGSCTDSTGRTLFFDIFHFTFYHDAFGVSHPFSVTVDSTNTLHCYPSFLHDTSSRTTNDGSGLTLNARAFSTSASASVTTPSGQIMAAPAQTGVGAGTVTDANGNQITVNTSSQFFDTLSSTSAVLTVSGAAPNPVTFTYTGPTGSTQYALNYSSYNIKTNFNCGIIEYTSSGTDPLVSSIVLPDGSQYSFTYEDTPNNAGYKTGRISTVTLSTGGTISYSYTGANDGINCADGSTLGLTRTLSPGGAWQYSRSGSNPAWTTTLIDPANDYTVINFEKDTASANFYETQRLAYQGSTSGTLLSTNITCYNGQSVATPSNCYNTGITSSITRITAFNYLPNSAGLQSETDSTYDNFGLIKEVDDYDYGSGAVGALTRKTITNYTALGSGIVDRPLSVTIENGSNVIKAFTSYGYDETSVTATSGTPQHGSVSGSRGNLTSVNAQATGTTNLYRKYTYFDTGTLATSTDLSTSSATNDATTTYNYSSTGSCGNSFVTSISDPVGSMSRSFTWDCNGGVLLSVADENGNTSSTAYTGTNYTNVFWRPYSTTDAAGNVTNDFYSLDSNNHEFQTESKSATFNSGNSIVDKVTTNDGLGRTIFSQTRRGPTSSNYDTVATCYDSSGRVSLTTLPYSAALATSSTSCPSTNPGTSYTYDALGRTLSATDTGGGSTSYSYNQNDVLQTRSSPTVSKQSEFDALGRLTSVCEITSGTSSWPSASCNPPQNTSATGYLTKYGYDLLGNTTSVTQNAQASTGQQSRTYVYDMLGRLTSETNPETNNTATTYSYDSLSSDAACGTITSAGNLVKRVDAAGNAACYSGYDALHRVGAITYPSSSTPAKHFVYDTATVNGTAMSNAKTRLAEAYTCIGTCSSKTTDLGFSYWPTGQATDVWELTPHSGTNYYYHVTTTPWPNGAVNTINNLVGLPTITYGADGEGRVSKVSASNSSNPIATAITYNAASQMTAISYGPQGSSDNDTFTFYSSTDRMKTYVFSMGSTPQTDTGTLTWYSNGSLQQLAIVDQINSLNTQTCNYTHDALGRIASANCGTAIFNQNFSYDPFGNITKTVPTGSTGTAFQPSYDYTNKTNRMSSTPFTYNGNNGALTADNSHGYGWDTANRLSTVDSGTTNGVCVTYDALDRVVEQAKGSACATSPTSTTEIVYSSSGTKLALMNGSTLTKAFVSLSGGAQAVYNTSGLQYYRHPDWLGSSRLATTPSRTKYYDVAYAPFGENYAGSGTQNLSFTGQNQDTESSASGGAGGLYDFMFRRHSPVQGRWLSPDPAGLAAASPSDPQTWNRYAYVANRPTNTIDAFGLVILPCDPSDPDCGPIGPPCDPEFGCDPGCDPEFGCDPCPECGGGGGGSGGGGGGARPRPPQRHGGVWPGNETLGLPAGLNQNPLGLSDLLGFLPGLNCGGSAPTGGGFVSTGTSSGTSSTFCVPIPLIIFSVVAGQAAAGSSNAAVDNKCTGHTSDHPQSAWGNLCNLVHDVNGHPARFVEEWTCTGTFACCWAKKSEYVGTCEDRGSGYVAKEANSWGTPIVDCCNLGK